MIALSIDTGDKASQAIRFFYASVGIRNLRVDRDLQGSAGVERGSVGLPATLLLYREGREHGRMTGAADWDQDAE